MIQYRCKGCGGNLTIKNEMSGLCQCEYCGQTWTIPSANNERKIELYNTANQYRRSNRFDRAIEIYKEMIKEFPDEAEAYWGLVICRYGIEYVEDSKTKRKIPTCHRTIPQSILTDSDYQLALSKASASAREFYEQEASQIDEIQNEINRLADKKDPYDIFICYKELDDTTKERTKDSVLAQDIYNSLNENGYKVFFSRVSLESELGENFEPIIFSALRSSKVMLLVTTSKEHMDAPWVRNEWSRYLDMMDEVTCGKKTLIPVFQSMDPYDFPKEISGRNLQAQDAGKVGYLQDLLRGLEKIFENPSERASPFSVGSGDAAGIVERAYMFLNDHNFEKANEYFEKALNTDSHNAAAYVGKFLAKRFVTSMDELSDTLDPLESDPLEIEENAYTYALKYGNVSLKKQIREVNEKIVNRNKDRIDDFIEQRISEMSAEKDENLAKIQESDKQLKDIRSKKSKTQNINKYLKILRVISVVVCCIFTLMGIRHFWLNSTGFLGKAGAIFCILIMVCIVYFICNIIVSIVRKFIFTFNQSILYFDQVVEQIKTTVEVAGQRNTVLDKAIQKADLSKGEWIEQYSTNSFERATDMIDKALGVYESNKSSLLI